MIGAGVINIPKIPELRKRLLFTLFFLAIYRLGVAIPTPGVDREAFLEFFNQAKGTLLGMFDMFSGGALERFSVFTLGIMPYITASIIMQLMTAVFPYLEKLQKEGEYGKRKMTQYTRYLTVFISFLQGFMISYGLESAQTLAGMPIVLQGGIGFRLMTALTLTAGTSFIMWLAEQITERGVGNGSSLIIYAGIVVRLPNAIVTTFKQIFMGETSFFALIFLLGLMLVVIGVIIYFERAHRKIPVQYARRVVGRKVYGGVQTHLPLKLNTAGVIPPIFASSLLVFPMTIANFIQKPWAEAVAKYLTSTSFAYNALYVVMIIFFCYFYTAVIFNPVDISENLRKYGGYVPGIRPGKNTADYIDSILGRITLPGALYISTICVLPNFLIDWFNVPFYFGGTSLLIVVGVAMDTVQQIEMHLLSRNYDGFMKGGALKGRGA
ncbi:MAG TPA: preprotein translocase subunit SecY [bacterium]